jgi:hypothetical protein
VGEKSNLGRQIHADVYRALRSVEVNEIEDVGRDDLRKIAILAADLAAALDAVFGRRYSGDGETSDDQASTTGTLHNEDH